MNPNQSVLKCIALMLLIIGGIKQSYAQNYSNWGRKQSITINSSQVQGSSNLANYPFFYTLDYLNLENYILPRLVEVAKHIKENVSMKIELSTVKIKMLKN